MPTGNKKTTQQQQQQTTSRKNGKGTSTTIITTKSDTNEKTTTTTIATTSHDILSKSIITNQLEQLDDTDCYASAWADALFKYNQRQQRQQQHNQQQHNSSTCSSGDQPSSSSSSYSLQWGGKGRGGKNISRRTYQPYDIIVDNVRLEYTVMTQKKKGSSSISSSSSNSNSINTTPNTTSTSTVQSSSSTRSSNAIVAATTTTIKSSSTNKNQLLLLEDTKLKLLHGHIYALIGPSGCGKSTLLRRIHSGKIPGFPPHISTLYIPQEILLVSSVQSSSSSSSVQQEDSNVVVDNNNTTTTMNETATVAEDDVVTTTTTTPIQYVIEQCRQYTIQSQVTTAAELIQLENEMDLLLLEPDNNNDHDNDTNHDNHEDDDEKKQMKLENLVNRIAELEVEIENHNEKKKEKSSNDECESESQSSSSIMMAQEALQFMGVLEPYWNVPLDQLSEGMTKKIALAVVVAVVLILPKTTTSSSTPKIDLLLLDEPTSGLDVDGLLRLRQMISMITKKDSNDRGSTNSGGGDQDTLTSYSGSYNTTTVLFVSHDIDFLNSIATNVIDVSQQKLIYYLGTYYDYCRVVEQNENYHLKTMATIEKKTNIMQQTIQNLNKTKNNSNPNKNRKVNKQIESHKKRFEKIIQQDQTNTNSVPLSSTRYRRVGGTGPNHNDEQQQQPNKSIQFMFPKVTSQYHEPVIMAMDVGYCLPEYNNNNNNNNKSSNSINERTVLETVQEQYHDTAGTNTMILPTKRDGFLFDCVDLCIEEGNVYCFLGANSCGKTTLLQLLAKHKSYCNSSASNITQQKKMMIPPTEGKIVHALNVNVAYIDRTYADSILLQLNQHHHHMPNNTDVTSEQQQQQKKNVYHPNMTVLEYLTVKYPLKTNQDIRGTLTSFGLTSPQQVDGTPVQYLSGGERTRLGYVDTLLQYNNDINVLVLDEPTSNLDVDSVNALLYGLKQWQTGGGQSSLSSSGISSGGGGGGRGTILVASHDFHFIRTLQALCYVIIPHEGKIRRVHGTIDDYLRSFVY